MPKRKSVSEEFPNLPAARWLYIAFRTFKVLADHWRYQSGRDEITHQEWAERLGLPVDFAKRIFDDLANDGCIEVASVGPAGTKWRFVPTAELPAAAQEYQASKG